MKRISCFALLVQPAARVIPTLRSIYTKERLIILSRIARVQHTATIQRRGCQQVRVGHRERPGPHGDTHIRSQLVAFSWRRGIMKKTACSSIEKVLNTTSLSGWSWESSSVTQNLLAISDHSRHIGPCFRRGFNETQTRRPQSTRHTGSESKAMQSKWASIL